MPSAYQRRKQEIAYYRQCTGELEEIVRAIVKNNPHVKTPLFGAEVDGDTIITPYNNGDFLMSVATGITNYRGPL